MNKYQNKYHERYKQLLYEARTPYTPNAYYQTREEELKILWPLIAVEDRRLDALKHKAWNRRYNSPEAVKARAEQDRIAAEKKAAEEKEYKEQVAINYGAATADPCPKCNAKPGEQCRYRHGNQSNITSETFPKRAPHRERTKAYALRKVKAPTVYAPKPKKPSLTKRVIWAMEYFPKYGEAISIKCEQCKATAGNPCRHARSGFDIDAPHAPRKEYRDRLRAAREQERLNEEEGWTYPAPRIDQFCGGAPTLHRITRVVLNLEEQKAQRFDLSGILTQQDIVSRWNNPYTLNSGFSKMFRDQYYATSHRKMPSTEPADTWSPPRNSTSPAEKEMEQTLKDVDNGKYPET